MGRQRKQRRERTVRGSLDRVPLVGTSWLRSYGNLFSVCVHVHACSYGLEFFMAKCSKETESTLSKSLERKAQISVTKEARPVIATKLAKETGEGLYISKF